MVEKKIKLKNFCVQNGIELIILFGSRAEFDEKGVHDDSDFDIAILTIPPYSLNKNLTFYNKILFGLSEIFNIPAEKIDLTNINSAEPFLKYQILSQSKLLYGSKKQYCNLQLASLKEYLDMASFRRFQEQFILRRQKLLTKTYVK